MHLCSTVYSIVHYPHHIIATTTNMFISVVIIIVISGWAVGKHCVQHVLGAARAKTSPVGG